MARSIREALAYKAPFVIDKLVKDGNVDSVEEGEALFLEVKRYLVLVASEPRPWDMHSLRVDEAWHQFILFTKPYAEYCQRFFGRYLHHSPNPTADPGPAGAGPVDEPDASMSFAEFRQRYQERFGPQLPDFWLDRRSLSPERRVLHRSPGSVGLRNAGDGAELVGADGAPVFSINEFGRSALAFVARTRAFYVRELPGELDDGEKVALVEALVQARVLRVGG